MPSESYTLTGLRPEGEALDLLIRRAQEGEEAAFEEILALFEGKALALAFHLGASREDAEDIAQEAFLRLFRHVGSYQGRRRFTAWFYRIVVNVARDHLREGRQRRRLAGGEAPETLERRPGPAESAAGAPDASLLEEERRDQVRRALLDLSEREREVVILREIHGLTTWQVARALGLNPITVRRHAMQARRRLREILGG